MPWLDESKVTSQSFPYVSVVLGSAGDTTYTIPYQQFKEVNIEGKTNLSRKGQIKFVDVVGEWPDILIKIGAESNKPSNVRAPNIRITFGWKGLKGMTSCLAELSGMIIKSSMDITDDGQTMITLDYIETADSITSSLRFMNPNDIEAIYKAKTQSGGKGCPLSNALVSDKLKWLTNWDNAGGVQVIKSLKDNKIQYTFEDTFDDKAVDFNVGFADYLCDIINELTAKAQHKKVDGENYSYERGIIYVKNGITYIPYVWRKAPSESNEKPDTVLDDMEKGPTLVWKKTASDGEKQILSFTSDLNSKTSLMMQAQDEINKKLMDFSEQDMQYLNNMLQKKGEDGLKDVYKPGFLCFGMSKDEADGRNTTITKVNNLLESLKSDTSDSQNDQLSAILANNVFKATVKIIGDPKMGTDYLPWNCRMATNFNSVGGFGKIFGDRRWALTYVRHMFTEGSYETELEMLAYPQPNTKPDAPTAVTYEDIKAKQTEE